MKEMGLWLDLSGCTGFNVPRELRKKDFWESMKEVFLGQNGGAASLIQASR